MKKWKTVIDVITSMKCPAQDVDNKSVKIMLPTMTEILCVLIVKR